MRFKKFGYNRAELLISGRIGDMVFRIDVWVASFAHAANVKCGGVLTPLLGALSAAGNGGLIFIAASLIMLAFKGTRKAGCAALIALAASVLLTEVLLKNIVGRARPFADDSSVFYTYWVEAGSLPAGGYSFPSGHTAAAMAFAAAMFFCFRKDLSWLFFLVPAAMGFSRVYFQVHYFTDVAAAFAVGFLCGLLALYAVRLLLRLAFFRKFTEAGGLGQLFRRREGD